MNSLSFLLSDVVGEGVWWELGFFDEYFILLLPYRLQAGRDLLVTVSTVKASQLRGSSLFTKVIHRMSSLTPLSVCIN